MAEDNRQPKFETNVCNGLKDNQCHRPTAETTDNGRFHELLWHSQAELYEYTRVVCDKSIK